MSRRPLDSEEDEPRLHFRAASVRFTCRPGVKARADTARASNDAVASERAVDHRHRASIGRQAAAKGGSPGLKDNIGRPSSLATHDFIARKSAIGHTNRTSGDKYASALYVTANCSPQPTHRTFAPNDPVTGEC